MSCNYAEGLSAYENKGVLGIDEIFDEEAQVDAAVDKLYKMMLASNHTVFHTGAGISTACGIPDFRGPKGVWTLEQKGEKPTVNISFDHAEPSKTHMALKALVENGIVQYIISQNIDGLHLKSGLGRNHISELHGNMFTELCIKCRKQFIRSTPAPTVGKKPTGGSCPGTDGRICRKGILIDTILDWEHDLPELDLDMGFCHSSIADLNVVLGSTLQIVPSGTLPLKNQRFNGKLAIVNLQPTKYDKKADLVIHSYTDLVMTKLLKKFGIEMPEYEVDKDPTKVVVAQATEWTIQPEIAKNMEKTYDTKLKAFPKKRHLVDDDKDCIKNVKMKKEPIKKEEV